MTMRDFETSDFDNFTMKELDPIIRAIIVLRDRRLNPRLGIKGKDFVVHWYDKKFHMFLTLKEEKKTLCLRVFRENSGGGLITSKWWKGITGDDFFAYYDNNTFQEDYEALVEQFADYHAELVAKEAAKQKG